MSCYELVQAEGKHSTRQQIAVSLLHTKRLEAQRSSGGGDRWGRGLFFLSHSCCQKVLTFIQTFHNRHFSLIFRGRVSYSLGSMERRLNGATIYIMCNWSWLMAAHLQRWSGQGLLKLFLATVAHGHKHLEGCKKKTRLLFVDFSFAFNTIQPHVLVKKLISSFGLDKCLVGWILDF